MNNGLNVKCFGCLEVLYKSNACYISVWPEDKATLAGIGYWCQNLRWCCGTWVPPGAWQCRLHVGSYRIKAVTGFHVEKNQCNISGTLMFCSIRHHQIAPQTVQELGPHLGGEPPEHHLSGPCPVIVRNWFKHNLPSVILSSYIDSLSRWTSLLSFFLLSLLGCLSPLWRVIVFISIQLYGTLLLCI